MDENNSRRRLHDASNSSSEKECLPSSPKQPTIEKQSVECVGVDSSLNETSEEAKISSLESYPSTLKQGNIPKQIECAELDSFSMVTVGSDEAEIQKPESEDLIIKSKTCGLDLLSSVATSKINAKQNKSESERTTPVGSKTSEKQVLCLPQEKESAINTNPTSRTQDNSAGCYLVYEKDSYDEAAAEAVTSEYANKYASEYTKELLFSIDVMTLVRHLNNLDCKWITYATSGKAIESPCDAVLDEALRKIWLHIKEDFDNAFGAETVANYHKFQKMILNVAKKGELRGYDEKHFLMQCLVLAQLAVWAEKQGISDAIEFVPLVICQIIQNFKDSGKLPSNFWKRMAEKAVDIIGGVERL